MCEEYLELQRELNIWEMELAFAEIISEYDNYCQSTIEGEFLWN